MKEVRELLPCHDFSFVFEKNGRSLSEINKICPKYFRRGFCPKFYLVKICSYCMHGSRSGAPSQLDVISSIHNLLRFEQASGDSTCFSKTK